MTLFSEAKHKFLVVTEEEETATQSFLLACTEIVLFFDVLGPTVFMPVKSDVNGNIQRLQAKYDTSPDSYSTLQSIVEREMAEGKHTGSKSCTLGLLWLKRALEFIYIFLEVFLTGEEDVVKCANKAYEESLKMYHGWLVRGIFKLAVRAVPYRKDLISALKRDRSVSDEQLYEDIRTSLANLKANIDAINRFYMVKGLHSDATV